MDACQGTRHDPIRSDACCLQRQKKKKKIPKTGEAAKVLKKWYILVVTFRGVY